MPPATRNERRLQASKRRILGELQDQNDMDYSIAETENQKPNMKTSSDIGFISKDLNITNPTHIRLLLDDIETQLKQKQELITAETDTGKQEQQQVHFSGMVKLKKDVKKMTVREFNAQHNCDLIQMLHDLTTATSTKQNQPNNHNNKKRNNKAMATPAPLRAGRKKAPGTIRTVQRGEQIFSKNGSPVDQVDEGALIATVTKKRRGNTSAAFDINVGGGRSINLAEPGTLKHLDASMKNEAMSQLKVLQDQMNSLMAQLGTN